jgi:pSer/pThr/pTyr-binding forkhead associated (FHA) protein
MNVRLVLERKRKRVWAAQLRKPVATIGRALGCTVRVPSSEVSRLHCRLRVENGVVTVEDLESVNGTLLNGAPVRAIETVRPGDRLTLGPLTFLVEYELTPEALERLGGEEDYDVILEAEDEVVEEVPQVLPMAERLEKTEEIEEVIDDDDSTDLHLPDSGDLRGFLLELDDAEEQ